MNILSSIYIGAFDRPEKCPSEPLPELVLTGRSNVGKSSLINYLCNRKNLARTSRYPGKTRLLHFYLINNMWRLVDMPGYGYARLSKQQIDRMQDMTRRFLLTRTYITCVLLLIDSRIAPQKIDIEFAAWLGRHQIPFVIVFTKADKMKVSCIEEFKKHMLQQWETLPEIFITSSRKRTGAENLLFFIEKTLSQLHKP